MEILTSMEYFTGIQSKVKKLIINRKMIIIYLGVKNSFPGVSHLKPRVLTSSSYGPYRIIWVPYYKPYDMVHIVWITQEEPWEDKNDKESLLRIHNDKDCFLEKNQIQRKRRSVDFISKTNFDEWKIYEPKKLNWVTSKKKIVIRCL